MKVKVAQAEGFGFTVEGFGNILQDDLLASSEASGVGFRIPFKEYTVQERLFFLSVSSCLGLMFRLFRVSLNPKPYNNVTRG